MGRYTIDYRFAFRYRAPGKLAVQPTYLTKAVLGWQLPMRRGKGLPSCADQRHIDGIGDSGRERRQKPALLARFGEIHD